MANDFGINPVAGVGDIVRIEGYGIRTFEVFSYSYEYYVDKENEYDDLWYDLTCTKTFEYFTAGQEDIVVLIRKGAERKMNASRPTKTIDEMLDEMRSLQTALTVYGSTSGKGREIKRSIDAIKSELREAVESGRE